MIENKVLKSLKFRDNIDIEEWNALIVVFKPYFISEEIFESNKEVLRIELINFTKFCKDEDLMHLFNWIYNQFKESISLENNLTIEQISKMFYEVSNTDYKWMTNAITRPNQVEFSEPDRIYLYFKAIDDTIEGCFKPRFKELFNFVYFNHFNCYYNDLNKDFGFLLSEFSKLEKAIYENYFIDPIHKISISQWRNISAHKSFEIAKDFIKVTYGKKNTYEVKFSYKEFYKVLNWIINLYGVIRLSQVLFHLNYIDQIVDKLGGTDKIKIRLEASLMHLVHNMQVVGFEFISSEAIGKIYSLSFKKKIKEDLKSSLIHASQCLTSIACAIYDDEFVRDNYEGVMVKVYDDDLFASALIDMSSALKFTNGQISQKELIEKIEFKL